ncbi:MAG TPA: hypothetical protein P5277_02345 [Candidatus Paceibacterota bacterium]|nr:hypothetical protein [Candidatus Paceibacterota bacterium]
MIKKCEIVFANDSLEREFNSLEEDSDLKNFIKRALKDICQNAFCGIQLRKNQIPLEYLQKYKITNLWKYEPEGHTRDLIIIIFINSI